MSEQDDKLLVDDRLAQLAAAPHPEEDRLRAEERRKRIVTNLRPLVAQRKTSRRRSLSYFGGGATVLAAAAALLLWLRPEEPTMSMSTPVVASGTQLNLSVEGSEAEVTHSTGVARVHGGRDSKFDRVKRVKTQDNSSARLEVPGDAPRGGLKLLAGPNSEVVIERATADAGLELIRLAQGRIDVEVPKLAPGTSFVIVTPSIRAAVIGTAFTLAVDTEKERDTCLRVSEGLVRVESVSSPHAKLADVAAGEDWGCDLLPAPRVSNRPAAPIRKTARKASPLPQTNLQPGGTLAEETKLLAQAVRANQRQDHAAAQRDLQRLLSQYPKSPLAGEARALLEQTLQAQREE